MPAEVQPLLLIDQSIKWGEVKSCAVDYNEAVPFFAMERRGMIRVISITVLENPGGYKVSFMERK